MDEQYLEALVGAEAAREILALHRQELELLGRDRRRGGSLSFGMLMGCFFHNTLLKSHKTNDLLVVCVEDPSSCDTLAHTL